MSICASVVSSIATDVVVAKLPSVVVDTIVEETLEDPFVTFALAPVVVVVVDVVEAEVGIAGGSVELVVVSVVLAEEDSGRGVGRMASCSRTLMMGR